MTNKESGQVTAVSDKGTAYGIALGKDNWFNGKGKAPCVKGDQVDVVFEFEQDPKFGQVKAIQAVYVTGNSSVAAKCVPTCAKDMSEKGTQPEVLAAAKPGFVPGSNPEIQQMSKLKNKTNARICALECAKDMSEKGSQPEVVLTMAEEYFNWIYQE